jgi:hypothetical protein
MGWDLWQTLHPAQPTITTSVSGDTQIFGDFAKSLQKSMIDLLSNIRVEPLVGPYAAIVCGAVVMGLGVWQLRRGDNKDTNSDSPTAQLEEPGEANAVGDSSEAETADRRQLTDAKSEPKSSTLRNSSSSGLSRALMLLPVVGLLGSYFLPWLECGPDWHDPNYLWHRGTDLGFLDVWQATTVTVLFAAIVASLLLTRAHESARRWSNWTTGLLAAAIVTLASQFMITAPSLGREYADKAKEKRIAELKHWHKNWSYQLDPKRLDSSFVRGMSLGPYTSLVIGLCILWQATKPLRTGQS